MVTFDRQSPPFVRQGWGTLKIIGQWRDEDSPRPRHRVRAWGNLRDGENK